MTATGHPSEPAPKIVDLSPLREYERQQGGYWLYGPHCDVNGNGKVWVSAAEHEAARSAGGAVVTASGHPTAADEPWWHGSPCGAWSETQAGADRHEESCVACLAAIVVVERERADRAEQERDNAGLRWGEHYNQALTAERARADAAEAALQAVQIERNALAERIARVQQVQNHMLTSPNKAVQAWAEIDLDRALAAVLDPTPKERNDE